MNYIACCDASVHERRTRVRNRTLTGNRASKPTRVSTISDCVYTQHQPIVRMRFLSVKKLLRFQNIYESLRNTMDPAGRPSGRQAARCQG